MGHPPQPRLYVGLFTIGSSFAPPLIKAFSLVRLVVRPDPSYWVVPSQCPTTLADFTAYWHPFRHPLKQVCSHWGITWMAWVGYYNKENDQRKRQDLSFIVFPGYCVAGRVYSFNDVAPLAVMATDPAVLS